MKNITPRKALNPAYRKHKPNRIDVSTFINHLQKCIVDVKLSDDNLEMEGHIKQHFIKFFTNTFYSENYINTKGHIDLAIYLDKSANSDVGVIIEAKRPSNKSEFLSENNLNKKALHELLLYYLRERLDSKNNNIKHLIATNGYEWFLFKAEDFYNLFYKNKKLIKEYEQFRDGLKDTTKNELFYDEIAKKYIAEVEQDIPFVYLNFNNVNLSELDDSTLNTLYKIFSNVHLLGHSFGNDSNQLNKNFYNELLHIIGLEEVANGGKKIIQRKQGANRDYASLLENTIFTLEENDHLRKVTSIDNTADKSFNVGLELCLTWINRILFLKLLESQLATYHKGAKEFKFLNSSFINGFDELNNLFFSALAKNINERHPRYAEKFKYIPYLNSSLFERNELETETFEISALNDDEMQVYSNTVLSNNGKKVNGKLKTLDYLFQFLEAYDFATDGTEGINDNQESKTLINASVLGLIFEKINGYKDGSFYTPAYITMYMCKETIRKAVVQKFNESENNTINNFDDVKAYCHRFFKTDDVVRFNNLINSIRICDPAVGSGHFLVSALNELIAIKNELGILVDQQGIALKVDVQIYNDELYITDANGYLFEYKPNDKESTRIQKTLFKEKQTLIENCLFGVDINPNSVKICRLRLWIELLKNAYYNTNNQLQTLPNIDINIKCGNSLISRFNLNDDLKGAFKGKEVKYNFTDYKKAVADYKKTNSKDQKREVLEIINQVKNNFKSTLNRKNIDNYQSIVYEYENEKQRLNNIQLFGEKIKKADTDKLKKLKEKADKALQFKDDIINNVIFNNAFEWRFEFPEVLDDKGTFIGFDAVIGNPPYIKEYEGKEIFDGLRNNEVYQGKMDIWYLFLSDGIKLLKENGNINFIAPNNWLTNAGASKLRNFILHNSKITQLIDFNSFMVFDSASIQTMIMQFVKTKSNEYKFDYRKILSTKPIITDAFNTLNKIPSSEVEFYDAEIISSDLQDKTFTFNTNTNQIVLSKIFEQDIKFLTNKEIAQGIVFPQDFLNKSNLKIMGENFSHNQGIFALTNDEIEKLNLLNSELKLIKPYFGSENFKRYYSVSKNKNWLIYTDSKFKNIEEILPYPNIKKHLDKFAKIITSDNKPYGLHRAREERFFLGEKIIVQRKCPDKPVFTYTNFDSYVSATFYVIKTERINHKYLTALLNSKLIEFWLRNKGKMQGNNFQLDKEPLMNIPIIIAQDNIQNECISLVDKIIEYKNSDNEIDTSKLEKDIDNIVYKLYNLTDDEIKIIENSNYFKNKIK